MVSIWYHVIQASGYIFFGTASKLYELMKQHVAIISHRPRSKRTKVGRGEPRAYADTSDCAVKNTARSTSCGRRQEHRERRGVDPRDCSEIELAPTSCVGPGYWQKLLTWMLLRSSR